jgi:hypothetical protein
MMKANAGSEVFRLLAILGLAATLLLPPTHSRAQGETTSSILGEICRVGHPFHPPTKI